MAKIFITGSSDGLGLLAAQQLINEGHQVVLHARNQARAKDTQKAVPEAEAVLIGDLSSLEETKQLATDVNALGHFDAIIHNAGVYQASSELIFKVNLLAPYILTCLINKPQRLIYLSSALHQQGNPDIRNLDHKQYSYGDSKLHIIMLTKAIARLCPQLYANAVNPGWVPTKMGGSHAADDLTKGFQTQTWLATSNNVEAKLTGKYFFHQKKQEVISEADSVILQEELLKVCENSSGVKFVAS